MKVDTKKLKKKSKTLNNFKKYVVEILTEDIESDITKAISKFLSKKNKKAVYYYDDKLTGDVQDTITVKRALIGIIVAKAPDAKDNGKTIKVFKYNYNFQD